MSRIPPASVRLTSALLNYNQVATSGYYFNNHLKEALLYDSIVRQLANNMGFITPSQKRKRLPLLEMGVLPIYTQLRAKMCYSRCLTKSYHWFSARLFRGAQSGALCYQNASIFGHTQLDSTVIDHWSLEATPCLKKNTSFVSSIPQILRNVANIELEPSQRSVRATYRQRFLSKKERLRRVDNLRNQRKIDVGIENQANTKTQMGLRPFLPSLSVAERLLQQNQFGWVPTSWWVTTSPPWRDGFSFADPTTSRTRSPVAGTKIKNNISHQAKATFRPRVWSKRSLFSLFCLEQIIGKANFSRKTVFCPGIPLPSVRTSNKTTYGTRKKKFKTFYDIQLVRQLNSDQYLKIRKTHNFPRSYIDLLKPTHYLILEDHATKGDTEVVKANVYTRALFTHNSGVMRKKQVTDQIELIDFDRAIGQQKSKSNVVPKFWISRRFNTPILFNLFCVVEGQTCIGHPRESSYKSLGISNSNTRWSRLKSSFLFEFDVYSKSSNDIKSLRPSMSLRF